MTLKEAVNSIYANYVVVVPGNTQDTEEPILAGGLYAIKAITDISYLDYDSESILIDDDTAVIKVVKRQKHDS